MKAYVFPGQGAQSVGMGKALFDNHMEARELFERANDILDFNITKVMFEGPEEALKATRNTQPAIFLHSVIQAQVLGSQFQPAMVAGHSLGEFSALVANHCLSFEEGLKLVLKRALAMQKACDKNPSTMAAVLGLEDKQVEDICEDIKEVVVPANYNSPGQVVISGSLKGVAQAGELLQKAGAKRVLPLKVGGAFHSPLMEPARQELEKAIREATFKKPVCPVYQNVTAQPAEKPEVIQKHLIVQLTAPVRWTQTVRNMLKDGATSFTEVGPGKVLRRMIQSVDRQVEVMGVDV